MNNLQYVLVGKKEKYDTVYKKEEKYIHLFFNA